MPMMEGPFSHLCTGLELQITTHYLSLIASYVIVHICYHSDSSLPGGYTPGIYAARYIVFALTFVRSSVRMFVRSCVRSFVTFRHVRRIYIKVFG